MPPTPLPRRLARLPARAPGVLEAATVRSRLLGLAGLPAAALPPDLALHLPRTRSVHTFGMRFALDLVWLDAEHRVVRVDRVVPPCRVRVCRHARSVVELPACGPAHDDEGPARGGPFANVSSAT